MQKTHDPWASLRLPNFRKYITARFSLVLASQIHYVVVAQLLYEWTKDPLSLGLAGLFEALPAIFFALPAGHLIDRHQTKPFLLSAYATIALASSFILIGVQIAPNQVFILYAAMALIGLGRAFIAPSQFSVLTAIVPKDLYYNCTTWDSGLWQVAAVSGPFLGGLIYANFGAVTSFSTVVVLEILSLLSMLMVKVPPKEIPPVKNQISIWQSLSEGFHYVKKRQLMLGAMSLDMFAVLFGGAVALLPIFAEEILKVGPTGLGTLRAAPALGATIMGLALAVLPPLKHAGPALLLAIIGFGFATIGFGLSENMYLAFFFLFLTGAFDNISVVVRGTIVKTMTPPHMRARISAVNSIFIGSSNEIGAFESGLTAKYMGTIPAVIFGGIMTIIVVIIAAIKADKLRVLNFNKENWWRDQGDKEAEEILSPT